MLPVLSWTSMICHFGYHVIIFPFGSQTLSFGSFAVTLSGKLCSLEKQVECIRKFSELKVEPVLVNQPVHMGLLIHLNSFMDPDSEISRGKKACFQSSFLLDHHNEGWHSQGLFLARNLLLRLCLVIYQNYLTGRLPFYFLMAYL